MPDAAVNAANAADSLSLVVQDAGLLKLIVNYLGEVQGCLVHLSALPGTNAVFLRDVDRHAELTRVLRDADELRRDLLTASNRQAHGNDGSAMAATRSRVHNSSTTLSTLPISTVEALSLVGMSTLHWLLEESQQLHGHAHVLPLGKVLRALEARQGAKCISPRRICVPFRCPLGAVSNGNGCSFLDLREISPGCGVLRRCAANRDCVARVSQPIPKT